MSLGTQPILPDHAQQVPQNTPVLIFSKLISTMTIIDIVEPEIDDISWVVAAFLQVLNAAKISKLHAP
jgi:hypothetical protein